MEIAAEVDSRKEVAEERLDVVHVEVGVVFLRHYEEVFRERGLTESESGVRTGEDLPGLALSVGNVALAPDCEEERVTPRGVDGVEGFDPRKGDGNHGLRQLVDELSEGRVLLGRPPDDGKGPDGIVAVIDGFDFEDWKVVDQAVVAEVIAEGTFGKSARRIDSAGDDEVGLSGDREAVAASDAKAPSVQHPREQELGQAFR